MGYNMGIKTIKFDDMNWDQDYTGNKAYSQSKLAQIMAVYELQDRLNKAGKTDVKVYACHPGSSRTSLIATSGSLMMRFAFYLMALSPLTQSAEKGSYPELMCATEENLDQKGFYGLCAANGTCPVRRTQSWSMSGRTVYVGLYGYLTSYGFAHILSLPVASKPTPA